MLAFANKKAERAWVWLLRWCLVLVGSRVEISPDALAWFLWRVIILEPVDGEVDDFLVGFLWVSVLEPLAQ